MSNLKEERLFKFIQKCVRNKDKADLHSFFININNGRAYVDCREDGVYVKTWTDGKTTEFVGNAISATNRLEALKADYSTIDM